MVPQASGGLCALWRDPFSLQGWGLGTGIDLKPWRYNSGSPLPPQSDAEGPPVSGGGASWGLLPACLSCSPGPLCRPHPRAGVWAPDSSMWPCQWGACWSRGWPPALPPSRPPRHSKMYMFTARGSDLHMLPRTGVSFPQVPSPTSTLAMVTPGGRLWDQEKWTLVRPRGPGRGTGASTAQGGPRWPEQRGQACWGVAGRGAGGLARPLGWVMGFGVWRL